jgi:putative ABC transport system permease protein
MRILRAWLIRLGGLFRKQQRDREMAEELECNLQLHIADNLARGLSPEEARRQALLKLGGLEQAKELYRDRRGLPALESFFRDLRYALRTLRSNPGFAAVAILTLALGIGANSAIFSVANALLLKPLPFANLDRLVAVRESLPHQGLKATAVSPADFLDWTRQQSAFLHIAAYRVRSVTLTGGGEPELLRATFVSPDFFSALQTNAAHGRVLLPEESQPGRDRAVVISDGLWKRRFAGAPGVVGSEITLDGRAVTVVGILPLGFGFPFGTDIWGPLALSPQQWEQRDTRNLYVLAQLKPGVAVAQAQADMQGVAQRIEQQHPLTNTGLAVSVIPLRDLQSAFSRPLLLVLLGMAGFLLLIACANVASLLFARSAARAKEIALRTALGASRGRIVRQLLAESLALSLLGGAAGLLLARWAADYVRASLPPGIARHMTGWDRIGLDGGVLALTMALALLTTLLFGLLPALRTSRPDLNATLKEGGRLSGAGRRSRVWSALVAIEVALALVLLAGAGLTVKGFWRILRMFDGADPASILVLQTGLPESKYKDPQRITDFYEQVAARMAAMPGVTSVSTASNTPLNNRPNPTIELLIEGRPTLQPGERQPADLVTVSPGFFETLGIPLLRGRAFAHTDAALASPVAIISEMAARRYWPNEDPLGRRIRRSSASGDPQWITIVGIAADVKQGWFDKEIRPQLYLPAAQSPRLGMTFLLRASAAPMTLARDARAQVLAVDPHQPIEHLQTLEQMFIEETSPFRFAAELMLAFGAIALLLAAVGVFGVMSYSVSQRTQEIGVRIALGARRGDVLRLIVLQSMRIAALGLAAGLPLSLLLGRLMASQLFGVVALDLPVLGVIALLLAGVALAASCIPTIRAARVDPMLALRCE